MTSSPNWYKAHLIKESESINHVNYCYPPVLIPINPSVDNNQLKNERINTGEEKKISEAVGLLLNQTPPDSMSNSW